jgi:hypothetical protein
MFTFYLYLQLEIDGDFLYFLADAAVIAVCVISFLVLLTHTNFHINSIYFVPIPTSLDWGLVVVVFFYNDICIVLSQFQYGNPDIVCSTLVKAKNNGDDLVVRSSCFLEIYLHIYMYGAIILIEIKNIPV